MRVSWEPVGGLWQGRRRRIHERRVPHPLSMPLSSIAFPLHPDVPAERTCRFCFKELPDWRTAHEQLPKATPVMVSRLRASLARLACLTFDAVRARPRPVG